MKVKMPNGQSSNPREPETLQSRIPGEEEQMTRIPRDEELMSVDQEWLDKLEDERQKEIAPMDRASYMTADESFEQARQLDEQDIEQSPEESPDVFSLYQAELMSALIKLEKHNDGILAELDDVSNLPNVINYHKNHLDLTTAEIIAITRLQQSGRFIDAIKANWSGILEEVRDAKELAKKADENEGSLLDWLKSIPGKYADMWKSDPWKATITTGLVAGGVWAGWKALSWTWKNRKEKKSGWAWGAAAFAGLGLFMGREKLSEMLNLKWDEVKELTSAIMAGEFGHAFEIIKNTTDKNRDEHIEFSNFVGEEVNQNLDPDIFKFVKDQSYTEFLATDTMESVAKEADQLMEQIQTGNLTALLGLSDAKSKVDVITLKNFFEESVIDSPDFKGLTVAEVMRLVMENPQKYLTRYQESKEGALEASTATAGAAAAANKTPETLGEAFEKGKERVSEDLSEVLVDLRKGLSEIDGADELIVSYQKKMEQLEASNKGVFEKGLENVSNRMDFTRELVELLMDNGWSVAFESGSVILTNGAKVISRSALDALMEPFSAVFSEKTAKESLYSYVSDAGTLIVFGASAGAVWGGLTGGIRKGIFSAAKGATKAAVLPAHVALKTWGKSSDAFYILKNAQEFGSLIQQEVELAKEYLGYLKGKAKSYFLMGERRKISIDQLEEDYKTRKATHLRRKLEFYDEMSKTKRGGVWILDKRRMGKKVAKIEQQLSEVAKEVNPIKQIDILLERKEFQNIPQRSRELIRYHSEDIGEIVNLMADNPKSHYTKMILNNPDLIDAIGHKFGLEFRLKNRQAVAAFENKAFRDAVQEAIDKKLPADELSEEVTKIYDSKIRNIDKIVGPEVYEELRGVQESFDSAVEPLQKQALGLNSKIEESFKAAIEKNPNLTKAEFLKSPEAKVWQRQLDDINNKIAAAAKEYAENIAKKLSGGAETEIGKLPKNLRKKAYQFLEGRADASIPLSARARKKLGIATKRVGGRVILYAPLLALRLYTKEEEVSLGDEVTSAGIALTPVLGTLADFYSAATGEDYFTGQKVDRSESLTWGVVGLGLDIATVFGGAGAAGRLIARGGKGASKLARRGEKMAEAAERVAKSRAVETTTKVAGTGALGMMGFTLGNMAFEWVTTPKEVASFEVDAADIES